jgi:acetoin utilization deacetylase AcuC-like enzyme
MRCFYHPAYFVELPTGHPFPMEKFPQSFALLQRDRSRLQFEIATPAEIKDLSRVHTAAYLESLQCGSLSPHEQTRIGFQVTPQLYSRCRYETGGTIGTVRFALSEGIAANLGGGTHHAFPDHGAGFCLLNDVAVAIRALRADLGPFKTLLIDTDAHQGNGTNFIFQDDPEVFTYSIHVGKNYPAQKQPGDLDVELPRWVSADLYLTELARTLPPIFESFEPDLLVWISGVDPHENDRFGQMGLSSEDLVTRDRLILELHRTFELPIAILYGGGYHRTPGETARLHAQTIALAARLGLPF